MEIKCNMKECTNYNKKKKYGCNREADPHTCKGYLLTIIDIQQSRIKELEAIDEK